MKQIKAIIFDLGGTLIEYAGEHASWPELETPGLKAAHDFLAKNDIPVPDFDRFCMVGYDLLPRRWRAATSAERNLTVSSFLIGILGNFGIEATDVALLDQAAELYEKAVCAGAVPIPHGRQVLSHLKVNGYQIGLISNTMFSGKAHIADLERFQLVEYFETMLFSGDVNMWKPNVAPFIEVMNKMGVQPENTAFIGDDPAADVIGGRRAELYVIHFKSSDRFPSPDGVKPDATIHSLPELNQHLSELNDK